MTQATRGRGYTKVDGPMTGAGLQALRAALAGDLPSACVVMTVEEFERVTEVPNRLAGARINEDGDAV